MKGLKTPLSAPCVKPLIVVRPDARLRGDTLLCGNPVAVVTVTPVTEPGPPEDRGRVSDGVASLPLI